MAIEQIWPTKSGNFVEERQIYNGPIGPGMIGMKYRINGTDMEVLVTHQGPENRDFPNGWNVYASQDGALPSGWKNPAGEDCPRAADLKLVMDGTEVWFPDTGLGVT
jgi:hypothetical protein